MFFPLQHITQRFLRGIVKKKLQLLILSISCPLPLISCLFSSSTLVCLPLSILLILSLFSLKRPPPSCGIFRSSSLQHFLSSLVFTVFHKPSHYHSPPPLLWSWFLVLACSSLLCIHFALCAVL